MTDPSGTRVGSRPAGRAAEAAWFRTAARLVLGGVWIVAGILKLPDPAAAERAVRAYRLLPEALVAPVAFGLPALEIAVGVLLVAGAFVRPAAAVSVLLLAAFLAGIGSAWARGLQIDCGCFGGGGEVGAGEAAYLPDVLRDTGLVVLAGILMRWPGSQLAALDRWDPGSAAVVDGRVHHDQAR